MSATVQCPRGAMERACHAFDQMAWPCRVQPPRHVEGIEYIMWRIGLLRGWTGAHARHPSQRYSLRDRFKKICHAPGKSAACIMQDFPQEVLDEEGQCGHDDGQSQRSGLALEAEATGPHAARMAGAGPRGNFGNIPSRWLNIRPWHVQPDAAPATNGRDMPADAQRRP
jgi:hypothetical protein